MPLRLLRRRRSLPRFTLLGKVKARQTSDANSIAVEAARAMAAQVAEANGVYIDPTNDVRFGKRGFDEASGTWPIQWDVAPFNVVQVVARRTGSDLEQPDGEFPLAFGWAVGRDHVPIQTSATAFVEARDLVIVLDFSASMNDDRFAALGSWSDTSREFLRCDVGMHCVLRK